VITDFGLARSALNPGISGGSPGYMAPELYAGAPTTVASDIYALGVISVFHLPVGTLGLEDLQSGALLDHVLASGCRIIAWWPDDSRASCEMTNPTVYGRATFRNIVTGDSVNTLWARIEEAQSLEAVKAADYDLHFLSVPGIYIEALHLVHQGQGPDLILPVASSYPELPTDAVLEAGAFLAAACAIASDRGAMRASSNLSS
jgi:serine/threonine protein kinase